MNIKKVYIASPLFNPKEKEENEEIDGVLRSHGYETFLPQRDGFLLDDMISELQKQGFNASKCKEISLKLITHMDVYEVCEGCDSAVLNLNGRVPDEGSVSEGALCFRSKHPLVIYKQDIRSLTHGIDNPLITGLVEFDIVDKIQDIPAKLKELENTTQSAYSKIVEMGREFASEYYQKGKRLEVLAKLGKKYFS